MQYALLIYEDEAVFGPGKDGPAMHAIVGRHMTFAKELGPSRLGGAGLRSVETASTVRTTDGRQTIHDGPFAETKEQLGGFYVIEAEDLDAAIAVARNVPLAGDGAIEIRPLLGPPPTAA